MEEKKIFIEISGGCFQSAAGIPSGYTLELIDWDNLLGDTADTAREWGLLDLEARNFIERTYPHDYRRIQSRLIHGTATR